MTQAVLIKAPDRIQAIKENVEYYKFFKASTDEKLIG